MKFIFSCKKFFPLADKLHMFAQPCNILYNSSSWAITKPNFHKINQICFRQGRIISMLFSKMIISLIFTVFLGAVVIIQSVFFLSFLIITIIKGGAVSGKHGERSRLLKLP